jgi:hypothetical protein
VSAILFISFPAAVFFIVISCNRLDQYQDDAEIVTKFMELRKAGNSVEAYGMLSDSTKEVFSQEVFNNYCFVYRVIDFEVFKESSGYVRSVYNFYDKKYNKNSGELHTFYISSNTETVRTEKGKILFPHVGFIKVRKNIEERKIDDLREIIKKMVRIDPENPEVKQTAEKMEIFSGSET